MEVPTASTALEEQTQCKAVCRKVRQEYSCVRVGYSCEYSCFWFRPSVFRGRSEPQGGAPDYSLTPSVWLRAPTTDLMTTHSEWAPARPA